MHFMHIAPTNLMPFMDKHYNKGFNMLLTHLVLQNEDYAKTARELDGVKYLDNSFFELGYSLPTADLLHAAEVVKATTIICKDGTTDGLGSYKESGYSVMCIPKTIAQLQSMLDNKDIDLVGLSYIHFVNRFNTLDIVTLPKEPKIHILGMRRAEELQQAKACKKHIVSWDTSAAVWQGHLGNSLSSNPPKNTTPVDFTAKLEWNLLMEDNIKFIKEQLK